MRGGTRRGPSCFKQTLPSIPLPPFHFLKPPFHFFLAARCGGHATRGARATRLVFTNRLHAPWRRAAFSHSAGPAKGLTALLRSAPRPAPRCSSSSPSGLKTGLALLHASPSRRGVRTRTHSHLAKVGLGLQGPAREAWWALRQAWQPCVPRQTAVRTATDRPAPPRPRDPPRRDASQRGALGRAVPRLRGYVPD